MSNLAIRPSEEAARTGGKDKRPGGVAPYGWISRWVAVAGVFFLINILLVVQIIPTAGSLAIEKSRQSRAGEIPLWKGLIAESDVLFGQLRETNVLSDDAVAVMNGIQRESDGYGIRILNMNKLDGTDGRFRSMAVAGAHPAFKMVFLDIQAEGKYQRIAPWVAVIEARPNLQIESLSIASPNKGKNHCYIRMTLNVLIEK